MHDQFFGLAMLAALNTADGGEEGAAPCEPPRLGQRLLGVFIAV